MWLLAQAFHTIMKNQNLKSMNDKESIFETRELFREWLERYGQTSDGIWVAFSKSSLLKTLSAHEALEEALCFGWIDGQMQSIDEDKYRKYFARRREKSNWSEKNKELALLLIERGSMTPQGLDAISYARQSGLWENSKRNSVSDEQISAFKQFVQPYELAYANLSAMPPSVQRTYAGFYFDAKSDKPRQTRLEKISDRLNKNLKPM